MPGTATAANDRHAFTRDSLAWRLVKLKWPFVLSLVLMVTLFAVSLGFLQGSQAYVKGESLWSKAQKDSLAYLVRYAANCDPRMLEAFRAEMLIPQGDREARLALLANPPDLQAARKGFLKGGNDPADVDSLIMLFRHFHSLPLFARAVHAWETAERPLARIQAAAAELEADSRRACVRDARREAALDAVFAANEELTPIQKQFSEVLGEANAFLRTALLATAVTAGSLLAVLGIWVTALTVRRAMRNEDALVKELELRREMVTELRGTLSDVSPVLQPHNELDAQVEAISVVQVVSTLVRRLSTANQRLSAILELSPDCFVSIDRAGMVTHASPSLRSMTGIEPQAFVGASIDALLETLATRIREDLGAFASDWGTLQSVSQDSIMELSIEGAPARYLRMQVRHGSGDVRSVLFFQDVTRLRSVETMRTQFINLTAHELRTPMVTILGYTELIGTRDLPASQRNEFLQLIFTQARSLSRRIDDLVYLNEVTSLHSGDLRLQPVEDGLCGFLDECMARLALPAGRQMPRRLDLGPQAEWVAIDAERMWKVLEHLLSNAFAYSDPSTEVTVGTDARVNQHGAREVGFFVRDQGQGMEPELIQRIGLPFTRADQSGHRAGVGLGLHVSQQLVRLHGGLLEISSAPGEGTTVHVWLPARRGGKGSTAPPQALAA